MNKKKNPIDLAEREATPTNVLGRFSIVPVLTAGVGTLILTITPEF